MHLPHSWTNVIKYMSIAEDWKLTLKEAKDCVIKLLVISIVSEFVPLSEKSHPATTRGVISKVNLN